MSSLHVCYNCGKIMPGEACQTCAPLDGNETIEATWRDLFAWMDRNAWAIDIRLEEECLLVLAPNGVYHRLYGHGRGDDYTIMIEPGTWDDEKEFDFVMFEFWPEGVRK